MVSLFPMNIGLGVIGFELEKVRREGTYRNQIPRHQRGTIETII